MKMLNAIWSDGIVTHKVEVTSESDALALFNKIDRACEYSPCMVEFFDDRGLAFAIGGGRELSVITFQESLDPPYYISSSGGCDDETIDFNYGNEVTEYSQANAIPKKLAVAALRQFFADHKMPTNIAWENL